MVEQASWLLKEAETKKVKRRGTELLVSKQVHFFTFDDLMDRLYRPKNFGTLNIHINDVKDSRYKTVPLI